MTEEQTACCQACSETRLGRSRRVKISIKPSIYSYDGAAEVLIETTTFICYRCGGRGDTYA